VDVPFNREEQLRRLRQSSRRNADATQRIFRSAQRTGLLDSVISSLQRTVVAFSDLGILIYQLVKYSFCTMLFLFALVLAYYGFKYVLLFMIWVQNQL
jgi:hypothetical protein